MSGSLLDRYIGTDAVALTLGGASVPPNSTGTVTLRHGRSSPDQQPDAATCTFAVRSSALTALPTIGDAVLVELSDDAATWLDLSGPAWDAVKTRFTGRVTDVTARPDSAVLGPSLVTVTAVGRRARLGGVLLSGSWPAETDGDRAGRILTAASTAAGAPVGDVDAGTVTVLARDVTDADALGLLDQLAVDSGGTLVDLRDGSLCWYDAAHRRDTPLAVELRPDQVLSSVVAAQKLGDIVNGLTVQYGPGGSSSVSAVDAVSADPVTGYGPFGATVTTQLADVDAAQAFADLTVGRRSRPRWQLNELAVDLLRTVTPAEAAALLGLEHAALIAVTGFPTSGPYAAARLWVEGWTETLSRHAWSLVLSVSDYGRSGAAPRWVDVPSDLTWADVPTDISWLTAAGWDTGYATSGRWFDVPADLTWADYDPATTWADA